MNMWTPEEQKEHRKEWVNALRSGEFKQGKGYLNKNNENYCCIGVGCELMSRKKIIRKKEGIVKIRYAGCTCSPPREFRVYYGMSDVICNRLMIMNDDNKIPFDGIADVIETI